MLTHSILLHQPALFADPSQSMNKNNVIDFKPKERLLEKAGSYIESIELFLEKWDKGRGKNKLVEFAPGFAIDLVDLIEQNRRHSSVMLRILRLRID